MAWTMMLVPAWAIASAVLGRVKIKHFQFLIFAFVSALAFTTWDFYLDPHMVARGLWIWEQPSGFFGIPWSNYLGWVLGASFITLLANPGELRSTKLVVIYSTTWVFQAIAQLVFWSQPGPAIVGFLTMGIFVFMSWRSIWEHLKSCSGS
jgi:putative membrane protein